VGRPGEVRAEAMRRMILFVGVRHYEAAMDYSGYSRERIEAVKKTNKLHHLPPSIAEAMNTSTAELEIDDGEGEEKQVASGEGDKKEEKQEEKQEEEVDDEEQPLDVEDDEMFGLTARDIKDIMAALA